MWQLRKSITGIIFVFALQVFSQKAKFVSHDEGTVIKVLKQNVKTNSTEVYFGLGPFGNPYLWTDPNTTKITNIYHPDTVFIGIDSGYYKCNTEHTLLLLENKNKEISTQLIYTSGLNINKKRFVLHKLNPVKKRKNDEAFIGIKNVSMYINPGKFKQVYYENYNDFLNKNTEHQFTSEKNFEIPQTVLKHDLESYLKSIGYVDTTKNFSLNSFKEIELNLEIRTVTEHKFDYFCVLEVTTLVKFPMSFGFSNEKSYTTFSMIGFDYSREDQLNNKEQIADALKNVFAEILKDSEVNNKFLFQTEALKKMTNWEETLRLSNKLSDAVNLENSTNAVVTVQQSDGHGSGCVISNDGYIVTNYHVVGTDTSGIYLIFNSGVKKRCRFVRGNPTYDLSLLKVDSTFANPIKVNTQKLIYVGADVYAIGTPKDIRLGQSITKGIISAKRVLDERLYIQSDASVNKGNSGGALTNKEGELIGIVNAKLIGIGIEGVSFAIPAYYIEEALKVEIKN